MSGKHWTKTDEQFLIDNYKTMTAEVMGFVLNKNRIGSYDTIEEAQQAQLKYNGANC